MMREDDEKTVDAMVTKRIGERIRARRAKLGLSIGELAAKVDVTARFGSCLLEDIELGKGDPYISELQRIAEALGWTFEELIFGPKKGRKI